MTLRLARVTLTQHRFELMACVMGALGVAAWAAAITLQLDALRVPTECIRAYALTDTGDVPADCEAAIRPFIGIMRQQGQEVFRLMGLLPFAVGVLASVPIVARELEARTAQTAWSLNGSRVTWLRRQVWPIAAIVLIVVALAAAAAEELARDDIAIGGSDLTLLGLHGLPVVARFLAAFGLGLVAGAIIPRAVPALVIAAVLCTALYLGVSYVQGAWIASQEPSIRPEEYDGRRWVHMGWAWMTPEGGPISDEAVSLLVPDDVESRDDGLEQAINTMEWLEVRGYRLASMGIPEADAVKGWFAYDLGLCAAVGAIGVAGAFVVVDRRRP
jgi:hypothetical protein